MTLLLQLASGNARSFEVSRFAFLGLVLCNIFWSANPVMGKFILRDFLPDHAGLIRYGSALIAYLIYALFRGGGLKNNFVWPKSFRDAAWLFALGFFPFCFATLFHINGLASSRATESALIIAMEPLLTLLIAAILVGERILGYHWISLGVGVFGFALLSDLTPAHLRDGFDTHMLGNLLILISLLGEGAYSSCFRKLQGSYPVIPLFGSALVVGFGALFVWVTLRSGFLPLTHFTAASASGGLYLGFLGTTATYLYWMLALAQAPIASMVVTLFVQPLAGSLWGSWFLGESLSASQLTGGGLILVAILIPAITESKQSANKQVKKKTV